MPLQATSGAASYDAFGGGVAAVPNYIEDVFSTWLYTGNDGAQTITNGIDLSGKGGLVWTKCRTFAGTNYLKDTVAATGTNYLSSNTTAALTFSNIGWDVNSTGYSFNTGTSPVNYLNEKYASWTFRKQPKFFDVVTYTGNGSSSQVISHALGSVPGCVIIKRTDSTSDWFVYHRGHEFAPSEGLALNLTASGSSTYRALLDVPTSTTFSAYIANTNTSGATYVAYLFAHNAGGFGLTGTDNVISCGSFTTDGSGNATVNLGYEPQWVMTKRTDAAGNWSMLDVMRGMTVNAGSTSNLGLYADSSGAEIAGVTLAPTPNATGMDYTNVGPSRTFIYIAIRRGPMKVPTDATKVFSPIVSSASTGTTLTTNFPIDLQMAAIRGGNSTNTAFSTRLIGINSTPATVNTNYLVSSSTGSELTASFTRGWDNTGFQMPSYLGGSSDVFWNFRRAPGFFDEVCYTSSGTTGATVSHNLGVAPELMIVRRRTVANWAVYAAPLGATKYLYLNDTIAGSTNSGFWNDTAPTASVFTLGGNTTVNGAGNSNVAYLFASCPGVSKVGSYTGTGTTQTINCGFTGGSRFVMIKRTDSTGDWHVWDSARGIVAGDDPYLLLNSTAAEVTGTDYIDTASTGFEISSTAPAAINASGGTFIFLAIA